MTSGGEALLFWVLAPISVLGALGLLFAKKAVHAALGIALVMVSLGMFYLAAGRRFLGDRPDLRLHRRRDDAVPVRPDAGRRGLLRLAGRDDQGPEVGVAAARHRPGRLLDRRASATSPSARRSG